LQINLIHGEDLSSLQKNCLPRGDASIVLRIGRCAHLRASDRAWVIFHSVNDKTATSIHGGAAWPKGIGGFATLHKGDHMPFTWVQVVGDDELFPAARTVLRGESLGSYRLHNQETGPDQARIGLTQHDFSANNSKPHLLVPTQPPTGRVAAAFVL
jgi:hypothetical protein